jgi:hypothetical protein
MRISTPLVALFVLALAACADSEATPSPTPARPTATASPQPKTATVSPTPSPTPKAPTASPTASPPTSTPTSSTGAPPGYERSCAAAFPWGRQVTRAFVCFEPSYGLTKSPAGAITSVTVNGYAGGSFENNVVVDLVEVLPGGASGPPLVRQPLTYTAPDAGMPGPWSITLTPAPPPPSGAYRVIAHFESPRDGSRVAEAVLDLK